MRPRSFMLLIALCGLLVAVACSDSEPLDLTPVRDSLPVIPGSVINLEGGPPAGLVKGDLEVFKYDRRYFAGGHQVTREQLLDFYKEEMPKQGWELEEPTTSRYEEFRNYCNAQFISCLGYVKEGARVIVSAPIQLSLNPIAPEGANYHLHVEER
jgi:hypothetical protein